MAIIYKENRRSLEKWGIDVTVEFTNNVTGKIRTMQFGFKNQTDIDNNLATRMANVISNYTTPEVRSVSPSEVVEDLRNYFKTNTTLTRAQALNYFNRQINEESEI